MDEQESNLADLLEQRLKAQTEREWAERVGEKEITLEAARENVAAVLRSQMIPRSNSSKTPGVSFSTGILALENVFPSIPPSEAEVSDAIERSKSSYQTFQALRILATLKVSDSSPALKSWELGLVSGLIREPLVSKGPSQYRDTHRNMLIVSQIRQMQLVGIPATRSEATSSRTSGCDVVAAIMTEIGHPLSYAGIEAVWKNRDKVIKPRFLAGVLAEALLEALNGPKAGLAAKAKLPPDSRLD